MVSSSARATRSCCPKAALCGGTCLRLFGSSLSSQHSSTALARTPRSSILGSSVFGSHTVAARLDRDGHITRPACSVAQLHSHHRTRVVYSLDRSRKSPLGKSGLGFRFVTCTGATRLGVCVCHSASADTQLQQTVPETRTLTSMNGEAPNEVYGGTDMEPSASC
jgi:hypothetical protein